MKKPTKKPTKQSVPAKRNSAQKKNDIIEYILQDHKALKALIKIMKNSDKSFAVRKEAYLEFCPLLVTHAKPEEMVLYTYMKSDQDLRQGGFEGDVEHQLADQMSEEAKRTDDEDLMSARIKVLAELVEHHIGEEEEELLPNFRKATDLKTRTEMGNKFLAFKTKLLAEGSDDSPPENRSSNREDQDDEDEDRERIGAVQY